MLVSEFYTLVRDTIKRGATLDSNMVAASRQALNDLEKARTFKYMERFVEFNMQSTSILPRSLVTPDKPFKAIRGMWTVATDGTLGHLTQMDPVDLHKIEKGKPDHYWLDAFDYFWWDKTPDQDYKCNMSYIRYSSWPTTLSEEPFILTYAEKYMMAQTIINMAPVMRDDAMLQRMTVLRDSAVAGLFDADDEVRASTRQDEVMNYGKVW